MATRAPTRGEINRAGDTLRRLMADPGRAEFTPDEVRAFHVISDYRASFGRPLASVTMSVRQFVERESTELIVAQRLKRLPQILVKLHRFPGMNLARMGDIGGCRAILPGGRPEIEGVLRRMQKNSWDIKLTRDYMQTPKDTGYRAVHVIVARRDRLIEIQLRTPGQHAWAESIERFATRYSLPLLKDGVGPVPVIEFFRAAARAVALLDAGQAVDTHLVARVEQLRGEAMRAVSVH